MDFFKQNIIPGEVLVQLIAFLIVFWTLKALAWGPLLKALEARRRRILESFENIESGKQEIERLKANYSQHLQKIDEEARSKVQEAIDEGRRIGKDIQEKARAQAQETFEKNKENLKLEIEKARLEMKRDIAELSIKVSEKILQEKLSAPIQQEKISAMIDQASSEIKSGETA